MTQAAYDYDVIVVGSGFGGSVAALRLAEKGYRVHVLESGRRFSDDDFATTSWDLRRYLWAPRLGCFGVQRIHKLPDVMLLAGAGVGGGSLNYANTLYVPPRPFFEDPQWRDLADWESELAPHYATASRMLGVVTNPCEGPVEKVMREAADELGVGHTFVKTPVGVFFGTPGTTVPDPFFGGAGPARTGCAECGNCMVGCRIGAKNTLVKNYLALAERLGVTVEPLRTVVHLRPLDPADPERGYAVTHERSGAWRRSTKDARTITADQVVVAAGAWGSQKLLHAMKAAGAADPARGLPRLSDRLGFLTRTNSESLGGATTLTVPKGVDLTRGVAITASFHVDEDTHVENVRYGVGSNAMGFLATILVEGGGNRTLRFLRQAVRRPGEFARATSVRRWSERTVIALVMQSLDNSLVVSAKKRLTGGLKLVSRQGHGQPNPTWIPSGQTAIKAITHRLAEVTGTPAAPGGAVTEVVNVPLTAHFLGGCVISGDPDSGVVDSYHRVWRYPGLHVVDGSAVSANLGVNPSLTITAQAERAMSLWPQHGAVDERPSQDAMVAARTSVGPMPATSAAGSVAASARGSVAPSPGAPVEAADVA